MTLREDCMCELCENTRQHFDTTSPDWNWTYCPIWERRNKPQEESQMTETTPLTKIPINGWTEEHIGQEVRLMLPQGTVINDTITSMELPLMQQALIGPANELGMILARQDFWQRALIAQDIMEEMFKDNKHEDFKE